MNEQLSIFDQSAAANESEASVVRFFYGLSDQQRQTWKQHYERLIAIENDTHVPGVSRITGKQ